jgi:hypothetical protein
MITLMAAEKDIPISVLSTQKHHGELRHSGTKPEKRIIRLINILSEGERKRIKGKER